MTHTVFSGQCVDGYDDSSMGANAHCHNRVCDANCDDKKFPKPETYGQKWLPTNYQMPCSISRAKCKAEVYLYREKCHWEKQKTASSCRRDDQCEKGHCVYPWGWLTGTCSECKVHGDCPGDKFCRRVGSTTGTEDFRANRARNV